MAKTLVRAESAQQEIGPRTEIAASYDRLEHALAFLESQERTRSRFYGFPKFKIKRVFSRMTKPASVTR